MFLSFGVLSSSLGLQQEPGAMVLGTQGVPQSYRGIWQGQEGVAGPLFGGPFPAPGFLKSAH